jgi:hypothetical protein
VRVAAAAVPAWSSRVLLFVLLVVIFFATSPIGAAGADRRTRMQPAAASGGYDTVARAETRRIDTDAYRIVHITYI